jgi:hypothetical protein
LARIKHLPQPFRLPPPKGNAIKLSEKKPIIENLQMDKKVGW